MKSTVKELHLMDSLKRSDVGIPKETSSHRVKHVSSSNNYKHPMSGMNKYGKQRLKLAALLRDKLLPTDLSYTMENGTLLGAWRNGKFIAHDDDFDFAVYFNKGDVQKEVSKLFDHVQYALPEPYKARLITSYCTKIEVFDPSYGSYILQGPKYNGADYHHVTADLQAYQLKGDFYHALYEICPQNIVLRANDIFPISSITLEGEVFNAPCNVEAVLKSIYGSILVSAKYNPKTGRYEDPVELRTSN